jgi:hypothetical protein
MAVLATLRGPLAALRWWGAECSPVPGGSVNLWMATGHHPSHRVGRHSHPRERRNFELGFWLDHGDPRPHYEHDDYEST